MDEQAARDLLGSNVARLRADAGMTQESLAQTLGIHARHQKAIETGTRAPSFGLLIRLAAALQVQPHELLLPGTIVKRKPGRPKKTKPKT